MGETRSAFQIRDRKVELLEVTLDAAAITCDEAGQSALVLCILNFGSAFQRRTERDQDFRRDFLYALVCQRDLAPL